MTPGWAATPDALYARIWAELGACGDSGAAAPRLLTLTTTGADGGPELRLVVLRRADPAGARLTVFTDATTPKVAEIRALPRVAVLLWIPEGQLQIRARGLAEVTTGPGTAADWDAMDEAQRGNYGTNPTPGTGIGTPDGYDRAPDPARLGVLDITLDEIDAVHLGRPQHRRAVFRRQAGWAGTWVAP